MSCCGRRSGNTPRQPVPDRKPGRVASAESFAASPRYMVVARRTATDGKRFSTMTAAQDYARRSGGIIRQL